MPVALPRWFVTIAPRSHHPLSWVTLGVVVVTMTSHLVVVVGDGPRVMWQCGLHPRVGWRWALSSSESDWASRPSTVINSLPLVVVVVVDVAEPKNNCS